MINKADSGCNNSVITSIIPIQHCEILTSLQSQSFDGHLSLKNNEEAAKDFGNIHHFPPLAVLHPKTVSDISRTIKHVFEKGSDSEMKVAARGHGHSLQGQAQAHQGLVIKMESLKGPEMKIQTGEFPYVDVSGGELWINILHETLQYGLAPKSWTDYLHLTVGGTLSNAGISGQAFKHGPQINNIFQLEVVTGTAQTESKSCFFCFIKMNENNCSLFALQEKEKLLPAQKIKMLTFFMVFLEGLVNSASSPELEFLLNQHQRW